MAIALTTHKRLWANAGRTCAFPGCEQTLLIPFETDEGEVAVGKECHIVAKSDDGPRGPTTLQPEELERWAALIDARDGYPNLILLCGTHHDQIDSDLVAFTIERLVHMKRDHENAILERLTPNQRNDEAIEVRYAAIVDGWARRTNLDNWDGTMSRLVADAAIRQEIFDEFEPTRDWLLRRVWPRTLPALEEAFLNFRLISEDLESVASSYATRQGGLLLVDRVYLEVHGPRATRENVEMLERRSEYYHDLTADLAVEMTRAVNLICDRVREHLWPNYRLQEGYATIGLGLDSSLGSTTLRALYEPDAPDRPYDGLEGFVHERSNRNWARGEGMPPEGVRLPATL